MKERDANELANIKGNVYYFEELESVPKMLDNAFDLFRDLEDAGDVKQIPIDMTNDKYEKCADVVMNPSNGKHIPTQHYQINHFKIPADAAPVFLDSVAKTMGYIDKLEKKYPNEGCVERRVLAIIKNHAKLVTEQPDYLDALSIDPLYSDIINSVFATFPIPLFSKGKNNNNNHIYEYNRDAYVKLMDDMKLIEIMEYKQKFFTEHVIPYTNAMKEGKLTEKAAAGFHIKYRDHAQKLKSLIDNVSNAVYEDNRLKDCKTFIDNSYELNYIDRFHKAFASRINNETKLLEKGWPAADMPLLNDIIQWYGSISKTAETDPSSVGYNKDAADKAKAAINDISAVYDKLMNSQINDAKIRRELLKEFNVCYRKYEKTYGSMNGLKSAYIEERADFLYDTGDFIRSADNIVRKKNAESLEVIRNTYYVQSSNSNKLDVILRSIEMPKRVSTYNSLNGLSSIDKLNEADIYDTRAIDGLGELQQSMIEDFAASYTDDIEGLQKLFMDMAMLRADIALELGKEREQLRDRIDGKDPDIERKLDYLTNKLSGASGRLGSLQDIYNTVFDIDERKSPYELVVEKLEAEGRGIEDITVGELMEICGLDGEYGLKFIGKTVKLDLKPQDNYMESVRKHHNIPVAGNMSVDEANLVKQHMANYIRLFFIEGMAKKATSEYRMGLSESDKLLFDNGLKLCQPDYITKLDKPVGVENKEQYTEWVKNEGEAIAEEVSITVHYDYIKKDMGYLKGGVRESGKELDLHENSINLNNYYKLLDDNTHWYKGGSSKNFDNMMKSLDKLRAYSDKLAALNREPYEEDLEEYLRLVRDTEKRAKYYLDNKGVGNSEYAKSRISLVTDIHNKLTANALLFEKVYETSLKRDVKIINERNDETEKAFSQVGEIREMSRNFYTDSVEFRRLYQGDKYNDDILNNLPRGSYSLTRNAGYAIAMMALCAEKDENGNRLYSYDDIMDNTKLVEEKRRMFDKVVKAIGKTAALKESKEGQEDVFDKVSKAIGRAPDRKRQEAYEANKWIASVIYNGQKASIDIMDKELSKLSFSDPNVMRTDRFVKLMAMSAAQFDVWQEMKHCKDEIMELVKADHPDITTYEAYKEYNTGCSGPLANINDSITKLNTQYDKVKRGELPEYNNVVKDNLQIQLGLNMLSQWEKTGGKTPFSKWCQKGRHMENYSNILTAGMNIYFSMDEMTDNDMREWMLKSIADRSMFAGVRYKEPAYSVGNAESEGDTSDIPLEEGRYEYMASPMFAGIPSFKELAREWKVINQDKNELNKKLDKSVAKLEGYALKADGDKTVMRYIKRTEKDVRLLYDVLNENRALTGETRKKVVAAVKSITAFRFMREFLKAGIHGEELNTAVKAAMISVPELDRNMDYLSKAFLADMAFTDKGKEIAKASNNSMFAGKAAIALKRLENKDYRGKNSEFIKDAAYAMTAQQLRVNGELKDPGTGIIVPPEKYAQKLAKSNAFKDSLKADEPKRYIAPQGVAKMAKNDKAYRAKQAEEEQIKEQQIRMSKVNEELRTTINNRNANKSSGNIKVKAPAGKGNKNGNRKRSSSVNVQTGPKK